MSFEPKKRYSDEDLLEFKDVILKKMDIAKQELQFLEEQLAALNEDSEAVKAGNFDEGSQNFEREHTAKMIARAQEFIRNLEFALMRVQNKTYGICSVTGELIDKKRLMLVPHTTKSMEGKDVAAKREEQEKIAEAQAALKAAAAAKLEAKITTTVVKPALKPSDKKAKAAFDDDDDFAVGSDDFDTDVILPLDDDMDIADSVGADDDL